MFSRVSRLDKASKGSATRVSRVRIISPRVKRVTHRVKGVTQIDRKVHLASGESGESRVSLKSQERCPRSHKSFPQRQEYHESYPKIWRIR